MATPDPFAPLEPGTLLADKYRIDRELGRGGMGAVFLAENVDIGRRVAIKLLHKTLARDPQILTRFRLEARAAAAIGHPGIVDVLDLGTTADGYEFIVMERLEGETLASLIQRRGRLEPSEVVPIVCALLDALGAAHDKQIVHRDLKPENVFLVEPAPTIKILDFGISKFRGTDDVSITQTGTVMGSPLYMSPEQARGARDIGPPTDLYSVGVILYEALAGRPPFPGDSYNQVMAAVLTETPPPLATVAPGVPASLGALVDQLLAKRPADRPAGARAVRDLLVAAIGGGATRPEPAPPVAVTRIRRRFWSGVGVAIAAAVLLAGLFASRLVGRPATTDSPAAAKPVERVGLTAAAAVAPATDVTLTLRAQPAEARWSLDGAALGCNPCVVTRAVGLRATGTASAPGYSTTTIALSFDAPATIERALRAEPPAARTAPPRAPPHRSKASSLTIDRNNPYQ